MPYEYFYRLFFGLLSAVVLICLPDNDFSSSVTMLLVFALIIVFLGPCYKPREHQPLDRKWKFQLPTDNPQVAIYVANYLGAAFVSTERDAYATNQGTVALRSNLFAIAGINGVIAFWVLLAFGASPTVWPPCAKSERSGR